MCWTQIPTIKTKIFKNAKNKLNLHKFPKIIKISCCFILMNIFCLFLEFLGVIFLTISENFLGPLISPKRGSLFHDFSVHICSKWPRDDTICVISDLKNTNRLSILRFIARFVCHFRAPHDRGGLHRKLYFREYLWDSIFF